MTDAVEDAGPAVLAVLDRLTEALVRRDGAAAGALFAPDADTLLAGSGAGETARGADAVRALLEGITARWSTAFAWDWRTASAAGDVAWLMAEGTCSGTFDEQAFSVPYRLSMVLERRGGTWLVRQLHGSEPSTTGQ
jgi:uncharacterized protein (TIGR02246 family)